MPALAACAGVGGRFLGDLGRRQARTRTQGFQQLRLALCKAKNVQTAWRGGSSPHLKPVHLFSGFLGGFYFGFFCGVFCLFVLLLSFWS